jgi:hypothetical protein
VDVALTYMGACEVVLQYIEPRPPRTMGRVVNVSVFTPHVLRTHRVSIVVSLCTTRTGMATAYKVALTGVRQDALPESAVSGHERSVSWDGNTVDKRRGRSDIEPIRRSLAASQSFPTQATMQLSSIHSVTDGSMTDFKNDKMWDINPEHELLDPMTVRCGSVTP